MKQRTQRSLAARLVLAALAFVLLGVGVLLVRGALPAEHELWPEEMSCQSWFALPRETGPVRLRGCVIDAREAIPIRLGDDNVPRWVAVQVRAPGGAGGLRGASAPRLQWRTDDEQLRVLVHRIPHDDDARRRYIERHADELVLTRDVRGTIGRELDAHAVTGMKADPLTRIFCLVLLPFPAIGLLVLLFAMRRWARVGRRPLAF